MTTVLFAAFLSVSPPAVSPAAPVQEPEGQPSLAEAARRKRAEIAARRQEGVFAPRFTDADFDADFNAVRPAGPGVEPRPPVPAAPPAAEAQGAGDAGGPEDAEDSAYDPIRDTDPAEREAELRARLLDIEASLAAIGASGLPFAARNPNRFQSPLDAARLRAEQEEIRRELAELAGRLPER